MKKRIIISTYDSIKNPYYSGGGAQVVHQVAKRLVRDYDVTVLTGRYHSAPSRVREGVYYQYIGRDLHSARFNQFLFTLLIHWYALIKKYDVWIENFTPPFSVSFLPLISRKPVIGLVQMLAGEDMKRKYRIPFDVIERFGLKLYSNFIVLTDAMREKISQYNNKAHIFTIPAGIDKTYIRKNLRSTPSRPYILYLGRLEYDQKGIDLLLSAYKKIHKSVPHQLIIAGHGGKKDIEKIHAAINTLGLEKKVTMVGHVSGEIKHQLIAYATLIVIPSRFDTFVIVALEAMASGIPLVSFDIEGLQWIPDTCIAKAKPYSVIQLAQRIKQTIFDDLHRKSMIKNQKNFVKRFEWDDVLRSYRAALQIVLYRH